MKNASGQATWRRRFLSPNIGWGLRQRFIFIANCRGLFGVTAAEVIKNNAGLKPAHTPDLRDFPKFHK